MAKKRAKIIFGNKHLVKATFTTIYCTDRIFLTKT